MNFFGYTWKKIRGFWLFFYFIWKFFSDLQKHLLEYLCQIVEHVNKHYQMHITHTMQITKTLKQKTQTSYEHALTNTSLWEN